MTFVSGWCALGTGGASFAELSGAGYARQAVTLAAVPSGAVQNVGYVLFALNSGLWSPVVQTGVFDAVTGGNLLFWWNSQSAPFDSLDESGVHGTINPGSIVLTFPDVIQQRSPSATILWLAGVTIGTTPGVPVVSPGITPSVRPIVAGVPLTVVNGVCASLYAASEPATHGQLWNSAGALSIS